MDEKVIEILEKINSSIEDLDVGVDSIRIEECFRLLANDIIDGFNHLSDRLDNIEKAILLIISEKL